MTRPGLYLCGCDPDEKRSYSAFLISNGSDPVYSTRRIENGVDVCPEHGQPLYGFKSPPITDGQWGRRADYRGYPRTPGKLKSTPPSEDKRDNRDPEEVYREIVAGRSAGSNGHAHIPPPNYPRAISEGDPQRLRDFWDAYRGESGSQMYPGSGASESDER